MRGALGQDTTVSKTRKILYLQYLKCVMLVEGIEQLASC
jgi:hypothetical protein